MSGSEAAIPLSGQLLGMLVFTPLASGLLLLALDRFARAMGGEGLPAQVWRAIGVSGSGLAFMLFLLLWAGHDPTRTGMQFVEHAPWLPEWGIHWFVGIDGFSLLLLGLASFLVPVVLVASWNQVHRFPRSWTFSILLLETGVLGAFASLNLFPFYLFCELALAPSVFLIGAWGGPLRLRAAAKLMIVSVLGSLVLLVALLVVVWLHYEQFGVWSMDLVAPPGADAPALLDTLVPTSEVPWWQAQGWLFAAFALGFGVRVPLVPFHSWLPEAQEQAPAGASVLLAGPFAALAAYGFLRLALPLFPVAAVELGPGVLTLALVGVLYGWLLALVQSDLKRLAAYASLAQLGLVVLGLFALNMEGLEGGAIQLLSHGLTIGALFLLLGMLQERRGTLDIEAFGGIARPMPVFAFLLGVAVASAVGVPPLGGFVGELLVLLGSFQRSPGVAAAAASGLVLSAAALFWTLQRVLFGPVHNAANRGLIDLDWRERTCVGLLLVPILWIGLHPETLLRRLHTPSLELLRVMEERARATEGSEAESVQRLRAALPPEIDPLWASLGESQR